MAGEKHPHYGVVIIGAGQAFGGLGMAIALRKQLNYHNFIIFEKGNEVGGTWRANTYPGAASDIPIHAYSYSTDPKYDWQRSHGLQEEILDYIKDVTDKYSLRPHIRLDTSVMKAEWDNAAQHWKVITKEEETEKTTIQTANVLVVASGILEKPTTAGIPGIENFTGTIFHSAQYMHDVDLHGKRVAVIGNGCSATQIVPIIAQDPTTSVTSFARTPMWYVDGTHIPYSSVWKWIYTHVPMAELLHRWRIQAYYDINFLFFRGSGDHWFQRWQRKELESYIRTTAPKEYHDKLIPNYPPGCRRIIRDKEYLSSLSRPNNKLLFEGVQKITEDGILTTSGNHHQFDVIILATGFITDSFPIEIRGKHGTTITDYYRAHGGPQAYFGSTIPGFPNLLQIQGNCPNTSTGHASVLFTEECQFNYAVQLFKPVLHKQIDSVDIKDDATDNFNDWIQRRTDTSVFVKCASWYRVGQKGKVAAIWPGAVAVFWWKLLWVKWSDYETQGKHRTLWAVRRRLARSVRLLVAALILGAVGAAGMGRLPGNEMFRMLNARTLSPILRRLPWLGSAGRA